MSHACSLVRLTSDDLPPSSVGRPSVRYDLLWPSTITGKSDFDARVEEVLNNLPRAAAAKSGVLLCRASARSDQDTVARSARQSPQTDLLVQFGRDLIRGQVRHDHDDVEDVIDHATGDGCRLAVEVLTRQAKKGMSFMSRIPTSAHGLVSLVRCTQGRDSCCCLGHAEDDLSSR
jgi:hypothetical protein